MAPHDLVQDISDLCMYGLAAQVNVLSHRYLSMAQLVGVLRRESLRIDERGNRLPERVGGDPVKLELGAPRLVRVYIRVTSVLPGSDILVSPGVVRYSRLLVFVVGVQA